MTVARAELPGVLALGSNLGDREAVLHGAIDALRDTDGVVVTAVSAFHDTTALRPEGEDESAPRYLNAVVGIRSRLEPEALLAATAAIERAFGRVRTERWGDRTLDIDLIVLGGLTRDTPALTLPHPRAADRDFVLRPWLEIDADAELPGHGRVADLLAALEGAR